MDESKFISLWNINSILERLDAVAENRGQNCGRPACRASVGVTAPEVKGGDEFSIEMKGSIHHLQCLHGFRMLCGIRSTNCDLKQKLTKKELKQETTLLKD